MVDGMTGVTGVRVLSRVVLDLRYSRPVDPRVRSTPTQVSNVHVGPLVGEGDVGPPDGQEEGGVRGLLEGARLRVRLLRPLLEAGARGEGPLSGGVHSRVGPTALA